MKALTEGRLIGRDGPWARFSISCDDFSAELSVAILERDIARVVLRRKEGYRLDRGWSIAPDGLEPPYEGRSRDDLAGFALPEATLTQDDGSVTLATASLSATIRLSPFAISWRRAGEAAPFLADRPTQAYFLSRKDGAVAHFMARDLDERHYGLGDKAGPLDHTGRRFRNDAVDPCGFDAELSDPLYKMIPFALVDGPHGAHGVFYDNPAVGEFDCGATIDNYHGYFRGYRAGDGDLDYYVLAGPSALDVVRRFSWLVGGQAFPPRWSLGFAMTTMTIADAPDADARITAFIADCRRHGVRCDAFHFGSGYTSIGHRRYVFNWNREKFPDPAATMKRLTDAGFHPVTNIKPCLLDDHPRLDEAMAQGFVVRDGATGRPAVAQFWDGLGFHVDFTNPKGRAWWRKGIETALLDYGVISVWNDNNEFEIWDEDAVCDGDGRPFPQSLARPAQPLLMTKLSHQTQAERAPGKRPYAITRGGCAGIARYGQTWAGDNETAWKSLRYNLTQGLNMSLSGLFNIGHDVGGFHGPSPGPELFCRFVEFCALWPRMVMNSWKDSGIVNLPWMHESVLPQVRSAIGLRYRLLPYLYTQMRRAALDNEPVVRPLFLDFPGDPAALAEDCFLLGPDILVAPVLEEGAVERAVALPNAPGGWRDLHDGRLYAPGRAIVAAPLGRLPVFVREGALIPINDAEDPNGPADLERRALLLAGAPETATCVFYEDDGDAAGWRDGAGLLVTARARAGGASLELETSGAFRPPFAAIALRRIGDAAPLTQARLDSATRRPI